MDADNNNKKEDNLVGWGVIAETISKAASQADEMKRPDIVDMLGKAMDDMEKLESDEDKLLLGYRFALHVLYRLKWLEATMRINEVCKIDEHFLVQNYDFAMFRWAINRGFGDNISNNAIRISEGDLKPAELANFKAKVKQW